MFYDDPEGDSRGRESFSDYLFLFIYFWLCWDFVASGGLSLVVVSRDCSLVVVQGILVAVASPVVEHGLSSCAAWIYLPCGMWDLPRLRIKPASLALAGRFLSTVLSGKSQEGGNVCITITDSLCCTAETNTIVLIIKF